MIAPQTIVLSSAGPRGPGVPEGRRRRRLLCLLALTAALAACDAGSAHAATVTTTVCNGAPNHVFAPFSEDSGYGSTDCQPGVSNQMVIGGANVGGQHAGGFKVDALPGTAFVDYHIASYGPTNPAEGWQEVIDGLGVGGEYQTHYRCGYQEPQPYCAGPTNTYANGAVARELRILLFCAVPSFAYGEPQSCGQNGYVVVYGAVLVIEDDHGAGLFDQSGAVLSRGIWHHASDKLIGRVSNGAEGISNVTATLDGAPTTTTTSCDYHALRVCPDAGLSTTLDGATDGNHHLNITATTAAGVVTTLYDDPTYTVDSTPPTAPLNVALDAPGERYAPAATRTLSWTNPPGQVAPITHAIIHVCRVDSGQCRDQTADGTNVQQATITPWDGGGVYRLAVVLQDQAGNINPAAQSAPVLLRYDQRPYSVFSVSTRGLIARSCHRAKRPPRGARRATLAKARHRKRPIRRLVCRVRLRHPRHSLRVRFGHHATIYGVLTDTAGHALANQPIQVSQQLRGAGQVFAPVGQTTTDANGLMHYTAAPGPSRTLSFAYPGTDSLKAAIANVNLRVGAFSTFHVEPRLAHIGQRIIFSGRLLGGHIPKAGKSLLIEGVDRGLLVPVSRGLRTDRRGQWRFAYVFHNQTGAAYTYAFHLAIPFDSVYPYLPAATHALPVTILNP